MKKLAIVLLGSVGIYGAGTIFLCMICIFGLLGIWLWPYSINTWFVYFGKDPNMLWYHGFLLGMVPIFGKLCVPISIITWVVMMFLT